MEPNNNLTGQTPPEITQTKVSKVAIFFGYVLLVLSLYPFLYSIGMITGNCGTLCAGPNSALAYLFSYIPLILFLVPAVLLVRKSKKTLKIFGVILLLDLLYSIFIYS